MFTVFGTVQKHLLGELMQKGGSLKILTLVRGGPLKKNVTTNFPVKNEFTSFSMRLTRNFHGKKKGGG